MVKGKTIKKSKKVSKQKVSLPSKIKKGQITKTELKSVGFISPDNELKSSAPVESISGIGIKKGAMLRAGGIEDVGDYKRNFKDFFLEKKAKKPKPKPIKPKPKPTKPKPKPIKPKPKPIKPKPKPIKPEVVSEAPFLDKQVLEIEDLVKANDYQKSKEYVSKESDFDNVTRLLDTKLTHLDSIERDMSVLKDTEANRKALARLNKVQKLTKESLVEWESGKEEFLGEKEKVLVEAPRKGNEYIGGELAMAFAKRPKLKDWRNEEGKIRKKALRKHVIAIWEAEYGKGSSQAKKIKKGTKYMKGTEIYDLLISYQANHPVDFPE